MKEKNINLRLIEVSDASFIATLRNNKGLYLSKGDYSIKNQEEWIKNYKIREAKNLEFYFVIESKDGEDLGVVRIYDLTAASFCWGSWIIKDGAPASAAIESAFLVYDYGFFKLGFEASHFDVRKENKSVVKFHLSCGAKIISEDKLNYYFSFELQDYKIMKNKYKNFLLKSEIEKSPERLNIFDY